MKEFKLSNSIPYDFNVFTEDPIMRLQNDNLQFPVGQELREQFCCLLINTQTHVNISVAKLTTFQLVYLQIFLGYLSFGKFLEILQKKLYNQSQKAGS